MPHPTLKLLTVATAAATALLSGATVSAATGVP